MHQNSYNAMRLAAAAQVVFMHSYAHLKLHSTFSKGWVFEVLSYFPGVPIFFALSGYLITQSFDRSPSIPVFFVKRARRIYPALVVNILILEMLWIFAGQHQYWPASDWTSRLSFEAIYMASASSYIAAVWSGVTYAAAGPGFWPRYPSGVLWTLTVELSFYFVVPVVLWLVRSTVWRTTLIAALAAGSLLMTVYVMDDLRAARSASYRHLEISVVPYFWMFAIGMLLAILDLPARLSGRRIGLALIGMGAVMVACSIWRGSAWIQWKYGVDVASLIQTAVLCVFVVLLGSTRALWFRGALDRLDLSYGLYLWHMLAVVYLMTTDWVGNPWVLIPVYGASLCMAWISWTFVERPFLEGR